MSTPEKPRPSLAETLAHIDEALAESPFRPRSGYIHELKLEPRPDPAVSGLGAVPDELLPGGLFGRPLILPSVPRAAIGPAEPRIEDVLVQPVAEARHLPGAPGSTCPGCAARDAQPGWLARLLDRLFGDGAR